MELILQDKAIVLMCVIIYLSLLNWFDFLLHVLLNLNNISENADTLQIRSWEHCLAQSEVAKHKNPWQ